MRDKPGTPVSPIGVIGLATYLLLATLFIAIVILRVIPSCDVSGLIATRLAPSKALAAGGEQLRISGEGFQPGVTVRIGDATPVEASVTSPFEITVTTPKHAPGRVAVAVAQGTFPAIVVPGGLEFVEKRSMAPVVSSVTPVTVSIDGNERVRILGEGFSASALVGIGKLKPGPAEFVSSTELVVTTSKQAAGVVDVIVQQFGESTTLRSGLQFVTARPAPPPAPVPLQIGAIEPSTGAVGGGDAVTITGTGFTNETTVRFGGVPARSVRADGSRFLTAVTPMHAVGPVSVLVGTEQAVSTLDGRFSFVCPTPADNTMMLLILFAGALGGMVHALRSFWRYVGEQKLVWNWVPMYVILPFASSALAFVFYLVIRAGIYQPTGGTNYFVIGLGALVGMFSAEAAEKLKKIAEGVFTDAKPGLKPEERADVSHATETQAAITIDPVSGPLEGQNIVTITGTGFTSPTRVRFGSKEVDEAQIAHVAETTLKVVVPSSQTAGSVDVGVTPPGKPEVVKPGGYAYVEPKGRITSVDPNEGAVSGGDTVTVTGEKFSSEMSVRFGEQSAVMAKFVNSTSIQVTTPRQQHPGAVDVRIDAGPDLVGIAPAGFTYR